MTTRDKWYGLLSWKTLGSLAAPLAVVLAGFGAATPPATAGVTVTIDGGLHIRVGDPAPVRYRGTNIYRGGINYYPVREYYPGYYPRRRGTTIRNSTLINPTVIDSTIRNSTLINPTIINSPHRHRRTPSRSPRVRGVLPGSL